MTKLNLAIVALLSLVFFLAGVDKIFHFEGFVNALKNYILVPVGWADPLALPVIALELLIGAGLVHRRYRRHAALAAALILGLFTLALGANHWLGGRGVCGCWFTVTLASGTGSHVAQNLLLMSLATSLWWDLRKEPPHPSDRAAGELLVPSDLQVRS